MNAPRSHAPLLARLALFTAGSFAFGFALVPLYSVLCQVWETGNRWYGTRTARAAIVERPVAGRVVTIEFVASVPQSGHWDFGTATATLPVHPGKLYEAIFHARNRSGGPVVAQAVPSIQPASVARYFRKTECFCFRPQYFATGEARELPVRFIVDPELPPDIDRITLAYSFFDTPQNAAADR